MQFQISIFGFSIEMQKLPFFKYFFLESPPPNLTLHTGTLILNNLFPSKFETTVRLVRGLSLK